MAQQAAVLLRAGKSSIEVEQVKVPTFSSSATASIYASLFPPSANSPASSTTKNDKLDSNATSTTTTTGQMIVSTSILNPSLPVQDKVVIVHRKHGTDVVANKLANELVSSDQVDTAVLLSVPSEEATSQTSTSTIIRGDAYVMYAEPGKGFTLMSDWEALHDVCYGMQLDSKRPGGSAVTKDHLQQLAETFIAKRDKLAEKFETAEDGADEGEDDDEDDWTDEDVEQPRERRPDSDDDGDEEEEEGEEEDDDGEDEESELESDEDEDDPRQRAILETIRNMILKDGKLDMER